MKQNDHIQEKLSKDLRFYESEKDLLSWDDLKLVYGRFQKRKRQRRRMILVMSISVLISMMSISYIIYLKKNPEQSVPGPKKEVSSLTPDKQFSNRKSEIAENKTSQGETITESEPFIDLLHEKPVPGMLYVIKKHNPISGGNIADRSRDIASDNERLIFMKAKTRGIFDDVVELAFKVPERFVFDIPGKNEISERNSISLLLSSNVSYTAKTQDHSNTSAPYFHEDYDLIKLESEMPGISVSAGANLKFYLTERLAVYSGLFYSSYAERLDYNFVNHKIPVIDSLTSRIIGYIIDSTQSRRQLNHTNKYRYLQVPLVLNYNIRINDKWSLYPKLGVGINYVLPSDNYRLTQSNLKLEKVDDSEVRPWNFNISGGLGISYHISPVYIFHIEPNFTTLTYAYLKSDDYDYRLGSFGVNARFEIVLKKIDKQ